MWSIQLNTPSSPNGSGSLLWPPPVPWPNATTCIVLYSLHPTGLGWLMCQAVCWSPLRSLCHSGLLPVVPGWLICQAAPPDGCFAPYWVSCDQLNRLSSELYVSYHFTDHKCYIYIVSVCFFFWVGSPFYSIDLSLLSFFFLLGHFTLWISY